MKKIVIKCKGAATVDFKEIDNFQGDLKVMSQEGYDQLKQEVLEYGFNSPIHVWKKGKRLKNLDGHQRIQLLIRLESEGYKIPKVPIDIIEAKNEKQAKHILLSRISQYGKVTPEGLHSYMEESGIELDEIKEGFSLPDVNIDQFERKFFKNEDAEDEETDKAKQQSKLVHKCPQCGHQFSKKN